MIEKKLLLAYLRNGDFTHAGDGEAIELTMAKLPKDSNRLLLDVGCGLGGTAHYIYKQGWGNVIGIDIDENVISHAKKNYPNIPFYQCDVIDVNNLFKNSQFDVVYLFNAFYCFREPARSLEVLSNITQKNGRLILFDYSSLGNFTEENPFTDGNNKPFIPIPLANIETLLDSMGWSLQEMMDLTEKFRYWYNEIIERLNKDKISLIQQFSQEAFEKVYLNFYRLLDLIHRNKLGGTLIYAERK